MIPLWFILALVAAMMMTAMPLLQEKFKANAFALAMWIKVFIFVFSLPFLIYAGFPSDPWFYIYIGLTAVLYAISDVVYFTAVPIVGSGVVTRLLPVSVVVTFFGWFAVKPELLREYLDRPVLAAAILAILAAFLFFSSRLRKCTVSGQGFRLLWFVIFAACVGPIIGKLGLEKADYPAQATIAYVCIQSLMMVVCFIAYYLVRRPVPASVILGTQTIRTGLVMATVSGVMVVLKTEAINLADNPAYVSLVMFTDALWVLLVYRLLGRKESANIYAGLGIVACAVALLFIKSLI